MPNATPSDYQKTIADLLSNLYPEESVEKEWRSKFERGLYSPRVDVAVGPFSTSPGVQLAEQYDVLMASSEQFIRQLSRYHLTNIGAINDDLDEAEIHSYCSTAMDNFRRINQNSRCLIAIEIENKSSRKHLMGGAINAAALGRIGIAIGWTAKMLGAFINLKRYFDYLASVNKNTFNTTNLLILKPDQLSLAIEQTLSAKA